jgi:hypothetical protein
MSSFGGGPFHLLFSVLSSAFSVIAGLVALVVLVGVLFLLVRFLWFGTRAAQVYLARNGESPTFVWPPRRIDVQQQADPAQPRRPKAPPSTPATEQAAPASPAAPPAPATPPSEPAA